MDKWIAIVRESNQDIHIFSKYTDDFEDFINEVEGRELGIIVAFYKESDVIEHISL